MSASESKFRNRRRRWRVFAFAGYHTDWKNRNDIHWRVIEIKRNFYPKSRSLRRYLVYTEVSNDHRVHVDWPHVNKDLWLWWPICDQLAKSDLVHPVNKIAVSWQVVQSKSAKRNVTQSNTNLPLKVLRQYPTVVHKGHYCHKCSETWDQHTSPSIHDGTWYVFRPDWLWKHLL